MADHGEGDEEGGGEDEELDVTPQVPPGGDGAARSTAEDIADRGTSSERSDRADRPTENRWRGVQSRLGATLEKGIKGAKSDHEADREDVEREDDADLDADDEEERPEGREDRSDGDDDRQDPERKGEAGKKGAAADDDSDLDDGDSRYEVVDDATGDKFKIELPKGAVIRFQADGETVELKSVDDLVANAQKGLAFDRVTSRAGQENATLRKIIGEFETAQEEDSDLLLKLIFNEMSDEDIEALQKELEPYKDPQARKGLAALAEKEERTKREAATATRTQAEAAKSFWKQTDERVKADLSRFEYLEAEDAPEIQSLFYREYTSERDRLLPIYKQEAAEKGLTEADALAAADRDARGILTERTLRKVMRGLNDKYQKRAGKGGDGKAEAKGKREADQHNRRVDAKVEQRRNPAHRSLRGGGSAPRDRVDGNRNGKEPIGFDAKIQRGLARLRQAGREAAGSGAED